MHNYVYICMHIHYITYIHSLYWHKHTYICSYSLMKHMNLLLHIYTDLFFRSCYFIIAAAHKKNDFVAQLTASFGSGGLMCSFNDKELTQYVEWKQRIFKRSTREQKKGVLTVGKQPCGKFWVLAENCCINSIMVN